MAVGHAVVLAVLFYLQGPPRDKVEAVMVKLVDAPPLSTSALEEAHDIPEPLPPEPIDPAPPPPVPPEKAEQVAPPTPPPPKPDPPEPTPPKPTPPKPTPEKAVRKDAPKPKPKPAKPEWKPRSAEDVRKSANFKAATPPTPVAPPKVDLDGMRKRLQQHASTPRRTPSRSRQPSAASTSRYADAVRAVMYAEWDQPTRAEVGGSPVVRVRLWVNARGRITRTHVLSMSKVSTMDRSVLRVIKSVRHLPALSAYGIPGDSLTIDITFELE